MKRNVTLSEISDGRLYELNDMVKADCHGCVGCSDCCRGMGESIILDPLDCFRLTVFLQRPLQELVGDKIALRVVDGVVLPHLLMQGAEEQCGFLDTEGRCSIHSARPGICRIFPLGRYYENGSFRYFLQTNECVGGNRSKIKVSKWIDTPKLIENQKFIQIWHDLLMQVEELILSSDDDAFRKNLTVYLLNVFYFEPYEAGNDFYEQFESRIKRFREIVPQEA